MQRAGGRICCEENGEGEGRKDVGHTCRGRRIARRGGGGGNENWWVCINIVVFLRGALKGEPWTFHGVTCSAIRVKGSPLTFTRPTEVYTPWHVLLKINISCDTDTGCSSALFSTVHHPKSPPVRPKLFDIEAKVSLLRLLVVGSNERSVVDSKNALQVPRHLSDSHQADMRGRASPPPLRV